MSNEPTTPPPALSPRNNARRLLLGVQAAQPAKSKVLIIPVLDPATNEVVNVEVELRTPSYTLMKKISKEAGDDAIKSDMLAAIYSGFLPGTNELILDPTDAAVMEGTHLGGFVNALIVEVVDLMNDAKKEARAFAKK